MAVRQSAACARWARSAVSTGSEAVVVSRIAEDTVGGRYSRRGAGRKGSCPLFLTGDAVTLGHEVAGTVAEPGDGVTGATVGQRVLLQAGEEEDGWVHTRGVDYDGGWAEYALATVGTLVPVPDGMPLEQACIVPDAVSTPWGSIVRTAGVRAGQPVGVWGIGGLGAHAVQLLRLAGAAPIVAVDPVPPRASGRSTSAPTSPSTRRTTSPRGCGS